MEIFNLKHILINILNTLLSFNKRLPTVFNFTMVKTVENINVNSKTLIQTVDHVSNTGKIRIDANFPLYTSRFTSTIQMVINEGDFVILGTNIQPNPNTNCCDRIIFNGIFDVPKDGSITRIEFYLNSQDSGTTATIPAYRQGLITVQDIIN